MSYRLDDFCHALAVGVADRKPGEDVWPQPVFSPVTGIQYTSPWIFDRLHALFGKLAQRRVPMVRLASLFGYPSRAVHLGYLAVDAPRDQAIAARNAAIVGKLVDVIAQQRHGDPFCTSGRNSVWEPTRVDREAARVISLADIESGTADAMRRKIGQLIVTLSNYCEFLYYANLSFGREYHGPYDVPGGKLLVREYFDLKPPFWRFAQETPFHHVSILTVYPSDTAVRFDFSGRLHTDCGLGPQLQQVALSVDDTNVPVNDSALDVLLESAATSVKRATSEVTRMERDDLVMRWVESHFWVIKPLCDELGEGWEPSDLVRSNIKTTPDDWFGRMAVRMVGLPHSLRVAVMSIAFDPRICNKESKIYELLSRSE